MNSPKQQTPLHGPVPIWFSGGLLVLICWAGVSFFSNIAGFRTDISDPFHGIEPLTESNQQDPLRLGRRIFEPNCLICHQASGSGLPSQYPPLARSEWVLSQDQHTDEQLILVLLYGLQGPVVVRGHVYNGNMPAWNHFSDTEIAAVLSYIRSDWGNHAPLLTPEKVSSVRKTTPYRVEPWTWQELQRLPRPKHTPAIPSD